MRLKALTCPGVRHISAFLIFALSYGALTYFYLFYYKNQQRVTMTPSLKGGKGPLKVLFWTKWYGTPVDPAQLTESCQDEVVLTSNRSEVEGVHAIVFEYTSLQKDQQLPSWRNPNVPWILNVQESPTNLGKLGAALNSVFNWTWSMRSDSEIFIASSQIFPRADVLDRKWEYGSDFYKAFMKNKTKLAAWAVSNCVVVTSGRAQLVDQLQSRNVPIDIYGRCGGLKCADGEACFEALGPSYKFYMALENSLCVDYVTEKSYNGLLHGMVPVVYAVGNLSKHLPPNSYIDVLSFPTVEGLAQRLLHLDQNPEEYFKYFEWRREFNVSSNSRRISSIFCSGFRRVRQLLVEGKFRRKEIKDVDAWYSSWYRKRDSKICSSCYRLTGEELKLVKTPSEIRERILNSSTCSSS